VPRVFADEIDGSVGQLAPDVRGDRVDDLAQLLGDPPRLRLGPLAGL